MPTSYSLHARNIIFYHYLFFPSPFFFPLDSGIVRNPVWSTSKGGRFHGKISCVRSDVNTLTLSPRECLEWMSSVSTSSRCSTFLYLPVVGVFPFGWLRNRRNNVRLKVISIFLVFLFDYLFLSLYHSTIAFLPMKLINDSRHYVTKMEVFEICLMLFSGFYRCNYCFFFSVRVRNSTSDTV